MLGGRIRAGHDDVADDGRDECRNERLVADPADGLDLEGEHGAGERNSEHRAEPAGDRGDEQQPTSAGLRRIAWASQSVIEPDIWIAVPSRPTEAPNRCDTTVPPNTSGAIRRGNHAVGVWISSRIGELPPADRPPHRWYTMPMPTPATGRASTIHPCSTRQPVTRCSASRNAYDMTPARAPDTAPNAAQRSRWATTRR